MKSIISNITTRLTLTLINIFSAFCGIVASLFITRLIQLVATAVEGQKIPYWPYIITGLEVLISISLVFFAIKKWPALKTINIDHFTFTKTNLLKLYFQSFIFGFAVGLIYFAPANFYK